MFSAFAFMGSLTFPWCLSFSLQFFFSTPSIIKLYIPVVQDKDYVLNAFLSSAYLLSKGGGSTFKIRSQLDKTRSTV